MRRERVVEAGVERRREVRDEVGLQVGVVHNGRAELVRVTSGHDYGGSIEILSGIQATDAVILNPADSLTSGTPVRIAQAAGGSRQ